MSVFDDLRVEIYVALRTAPRSAKRKYASRIPIEVDAGTTGLTRVILKVLEAYELKRTQPPAEAPSTGK